MATMKLTPRTLAVAAAVLVAGGAAAYFFGGGLSGVALLIARLNRTTPLPNRPVVWEQGPQAAEASAPRKPNIIVILADDMGYNDISFHGGGVAGGVVPTPHINSIGASGVHFSQAYAGNATCSPSRAALLTGRYGTRFGFEFTSVPINFAKVLGAHAGNRLHRPIYHAEREKDVPPYQSQGLPTSEITIAKLLGGAGYHTLHLGKWHLGEAQQFHPHQHGFRESLGYLQGATLHADPTSPDVVNVKQDFDPVDRFLWAAQPLGVRYNDGPVFSTPGYMTDYLTDQAIAAMEANRHRPFFMYLAYDTPHSPLQATRADFDALPQIEDRALRVYGAMIRALDRNVGRVLGALREKGLEENTLVIFTSDNGGANYLGLDGLNRPFRGWKATFFEGGLRIPLLMRWPGKLPAGATSTHPVTHVDIYATAAAAARIDVPTDRPIDGRSLLECAVDQAAPAPHEALFWRSGPYGAVRVGDWKLQVAHTPAKKWLFDLSVDPTEQHNLAEQRPDKLAELQTRLDQIDSAQVKPLWPALLEAPVFIDKPLDRDFLPADEYVYWSN